MGTPVMIGPAEIEDMRLDRADAEGARPRSNVDSVTARRWGIVAPLPPTDDERSAARVEGRATVRAP